FGAYFETRGFASLLSMKVGFAAARCLLGSANGREVVDISVGAVTLPRVLQAARDWVYAVGILTERRFFSANNSVVLRHWARHSSAFRPFRPVIRGRTDQLL